MECLSSEFGIRVLCRVLSVCFSSFYAWKRGASYRISAAKLDLAGRVKAVFEEHRRRYGAIRISKELQAQGIKIGRRQVVRLMKEQQLVAIQPRSYVPRTTHSQHHLGRIANLLLDRAPPCRPNEVFIGDITYVPLRNGTFLYLACWQDMFSRKIVGWDLADNMRSSLIINALNKAVDRRSLPKNLIIHSDGGGQYASQDFRKLVATHGFLQSMTRKDNHYDNAMAESLFSRFKAVLMDKGAFECLQDAYTDIFEHIEIYYNRKRRHSGIGYQIPDQFDQNWNSQTLFPTI
ncbi:MAG TPA: IS3 family transposase [Saprospiraceae bacterium]|nr:IS3 family transposase [Saprospiraceae bacterium]